MWSSTSTISLVRTSRAARVCAAIFLPTAIGHAAQASSSARERIAGQSESPYELAGAFHCVSVGLFYHAGFEQPNCARRHTGSVARPPRLQRMGQSPSCRRSRRLSPEDLTRDFQTADRSVLGTLAHIYASDRVWLSRVAGTPFPGFTTDADRTLAVLQNDWPALHDRWREWAAALTGESAASILDYQDLKGNPWRQSVWQIVLHVVNHATHHRGQVSGFPAVDGTHAASGGSHRVLPAVGRPGATCAKPGLHNHHFADAILVPLPPSRNASATLGQRPAVRHHRRKP